MASLPADFAAASILQVGWFRRRKKQEKPLDIEVELLPVPDVNAEFLYISRIKLEAIASEVGMRHPGSGPETVSTEANVGVKGLAGLTTSREITSEGNPVWPAGLARDLTDRLVEAGRVHSFTSPQPLVKRTDRLYVAGAGTAIGGVIRALDMNPSAAALVKVSARESPVQAILCGSTKHLRHRGTEETGDGPVTWFPSRVGDFATVIHDMDRAETRSLPEQGRLFGNEELGIAKSFLRAMWSRHGPAEFEGEVLFLAEVYSVEEVDGVPVYVGSPVWISSNLRGGESNIADG